MPTAAPTTLGLILFCSLLGGCVSSGDKALQGGKGIDRVRAGEPTFLEETYMTMDERCRPVRRPTAVVTERPQHGKVRMATRPAKAVYEPGPYRHCNGKVGSSLAFEYTSSPEYRGRDSFAVRVRYADGELRTGRFEVEVH